MRAESLPSIIAAALGALSCCLAPFIATAAAAEGEAARSLFEKRILPILNSPKPSSCSECHLSGVDLKDYIGKDQKATYASLVAAGLVDPAKPDASKLLAFIARKPEKPSLVNDRVRKEEYEAFRAWLTAAAKEPAMLDAAAAESAIGPQLPPDVIRHARSDRVLASFIDNIWNEVGRCAACHSPEKNAEQVAKHGEQVSWIIPGDPAATMRHMLEADLIDVKDPEQSLLLRKPTVQVEHGGGQKMVVGDRSYKQFRRFLDDYASTAAGKYVTAEQLPELSEEVSAVSEIWLKITGVPEELDQMLLQVDLHRWTGDGWSPERWATSDRPVFGKGQLWQHSLSITAPRGSPRAEKVTADPSLPPGRYLVKVYVDRAGKLSQDFRAVMGQEELVGAVEVESRWPAGYGRMTAIVYPSP